MYFAHGFAIFNTKYNTIYSRRFKKDKYPSSNISKERRNLECEYYSKYIVLVFVTLLLVLLLLKFATELKDLATVEQMPKLEGKRMTIFISPKKRK